MNRDMDKEKVVAPPTNTTKTLAKAAKGILLKIILVFKISTPTSPTRINYTITETIVPSMVMTLIIDIQVQPNLHQGGTITTRQHVVIQ